MHKPCYGRMFPPTLNLAEDRSGKVFGYAIGQSCGMTRPAPKVLVNVAQWDECRTCPEFEDCYKLGTAQLAMESAPRDV